MRNACSKWRKTAALCSVPGNGLLRPFCDDHIPILWRPFHESEGGWFWWSVKGGSTARELYRTMHRRFTDRHSLNNLIWVWNSPKKEDYPGDEYVDIISRDMYLPAYRYTSHREEYEVLADICSKPAAIAETGVLPDPEAMIREGVPWLYYMTWSHEFCLTEKYNEDAFLKKLYDSPYTVTLEDLQGVCSGI